MPITVFLNIFFLEITNFFSALGLQTTGIKYEPPHFSASSFLRPKSLSLGYPTFLWAFLTFCSHFCLPSPLKKAKFLHPSLKSNPLARSLTVTKKLLEYEQQQKRQLGYKEREKRTRILNEHLDFPGGSARKKHLSFRSICEKSNLPLFSSLVLSHQ